MFRNALEWLENRTGAVSAIHHFLYEDIPDSSGWHQVLGSVALFAFLTQFFTGILLAFNYAPTPGDAYDSLRYIVTQLTAGSLIRGLHHWGASLMIIVVVLHMTQVFLWGAYKKPREATWLVGCVLLLFTLAYGLTGYLLPWDNRAYWGTVVTTQIASQAPLAGPYILRLLGSDGGAIGVVTFARFYAVHVLLLPVLTVLLLAIHLILVRRHGVAPSAGDFKPKKKFYPEQVLKDTVATFLWFAVLVTMAVAVKVPLGRTADPTDTSFIPRPEWYFLFLFQILKLFEGPLEIVGSIVLPTLAVLALFLVPFIDRGKMIRVRQRTGAISLVALGALGWAGLTARAIATTPPSTESENAGLEHIAAWRQIPPENLAAIGYFRKENCGGCHLLGKSGSAPDLTAAPSQKPVDWLIHHFRQPAPGAPPAQLNATQLKTLATFVTRRGDNDIEAWKNAPQPAVDGAMVYDANHCAMCHVLNGSGNNVGPALNGLADRRARDWVKDHFADPAKYSPGSTMPPFKFNPRDLDAITGYLMQIPK
ncbi:MAG TPA: cytochrome b N-terminal domain-containing protein [Bryobacteraceae bacterium]|jgi:ubiquinol-cytochrome c reductase cytochrome b subunit|nr:cytochrome b N-terminal domain-containing protein [Bryobacteraceae bacterium]